jgi:Fe-S oxidoreductase
MARSTIAVVGVSESSALAASCGRSSKEDYDHLLGELSEHYKYLLEKKKKKKEEEEEDKTTVTAEEFLGECLPLPLLLAFLSLSHRQSLSL